jgi:hypothetical protein
MGRGEWEVMMEGREGGRDARLRCEYDARARRHASHAWTGEFREASSANS